MRECQQLPGMSAVSPELAREQKVVFALSTRDEGYDVLLGVPTAAWDYMKDGQTHTFDLTKLGLPIRIILYGGPDRPTVRAAIDAHNKTLGIETVWDLSLEDFAIRPPTRDPC